MKSMIQSPRGISILQCFTLTLMGRRVIIDGVICRYETQDYKTLVLMKTALTQDSIIPRGAGVAQLVSARPSELEVPGLTPTSVSTFF